MPEVAVDPAATERAVANLLENARKYAADGGWVELRIAMAEGPRGETEMHVEVADNGPGVCRRPGAIASLSPMSGATRRRGLAAGAGLGLALVKETMLAHGGRAELVTQVRRRGSIGAVQRASGQQGLTGGACFRLVFPVSLDAQGTMSKARILVVEDEPSLRMGMVDGLLSEGFEVEEAADGEAGLQAAMDTPFDAMVLDLMLPKLDGFEVLRRLREKRNGIPVLILSARGQDSDRILGFEYGADDYVVKPTPLARGRVATSSDLAARQCRQQRACPSGLVFDGIEVDFLAYTLLKNEARHGLNRKELELLRYFLKHVGQNLSRAQILEDVWGLKGVRHTRTIDTHVFRLRKKIEDDPDEPRHIHTVRGVGYRFEAVQVTQL